MEEAFFGADPAAALRIREAAERGSLSHAILLSGGGASVATARMAAAAMECTSAGDRPCGHCTACRKVLGDIHPDVRTVRDEEHKMIAVDKIREVRADAFIRPNEGRRKIYLFPDCALLSETDQNVLLKLVEEGPDYAAFLFCAENPAFVLETLRSRCVEWKLRPAEEERDQQAEARGEELLRALASRRPGALAELLVGYERKKLSREDLAALLEAAREQVVAALSYEYGAAISPQREELAPLLAKTLTKKQMIRTIEVLKRYCGDCAFNVGVGHTLGALAVELEGIL